MSNFSYSTEKSQKKTAHFATKDSHVFRELHIFGVNSGVLTNGMN